MNTDPKKSTTWCGCDEGANHMCERHRNAFCSCRGQDLHPFSLTCRPDVTIASPTASPVDDEKQWRKERPVYSGVLKYFPDAMLAVANISYLGNQQHNPGEPMHWARHKSTDQLDAAVRHIIDYGNNKPVDSDGGHHLAKAAWRILAELQLLLEKERA